MTEQEAKTKWCPHVRDTLIQERGVVAELRPGINSNNGNREKYNCIASDCMMWATTMLQRFDEELQSNVIDIKDGRCGLAK